MTPIGAAGIVATVIGAGLFLLSHADYNTCQQWYVDGSQHACQVATVWHDAGVAGLVAGVVMIIVGFVRKGAG